jgi:CHAD domain-containing protein
VAVSSTGRFAAEQGDRFLRAVSSRIARTIKSPGVDEVHDLRVAIRRYRRILAVLKPCFPRVESRQIRRGLKQIMALAGAVRDHDIALRLSTRVVLSESPSDGSSGMVRQLQERREHAARALSTSLRRWVRGNLSASWREALKSGTAHKGADARFCATPADTTARTILPAMAKEHFVAGEAAMDDSASIDELHKFRIAAKNLRYTLDAFAPLYGESLVGLVDRLK